MHLRSIAVVMVVSLTSLTSGGLGVIAEHRNTPSLDGAFSSTKRERAVVCESPDVARVALHSGCACDLGVTGADWHLVAWGPGVPLLPMPGVFRLLFGSDTHELRIWLSFRADQQLSFKPHAI